MTAKIVTIVNQKGGSGKTTLSMQIGGTLNLKGHKTLIIDADPQGTAIRWASAASESNPFPAAVIGLSAAGKNIHREIKKFIEDYKYIIVDCPPAIESEIPQSALLISDIAIVPVIPSPADLWATIGISKLISLASNLNESLKKLMIINLCQQNTKLAKDVMEALKEINIPLANVHIQQRNAYRKSSAFGQTVHFLGKEADKAIDEIDRLVEEIINYIELDI